MAKKITKAMALTFATIVGLSLNAADAPAELKVKEKAPVAEGAKVIAPVTDPLAGVPDVVAKISDKEIKKADIIAFLKEAMEGNPKAKDMTQAKLKMMIAQNPYFYTTRVVEFDVLLELAAKAGIVPSEMGAKKFLGSIWNKADKKERAAIEGQLKAQGLTFKQHVEKSSKQKYVQKQVAIQSWIEKAVVIPDAEIEVMAKKLYDEKRDQYFILNAATGEGQISASHILIMPDKKVADKEAADLAAKKKALDVVAEIKAGKITFQDAAVKYSQGPSAEKKGSLGSFGKGQMVPEFEKAAFALEEDAMTDEPVKTQFGYHIILRNKATKEATYRSFESVKAMIIQNIKSEETQKRIKSTLDTAKKNMKVEFFVKKPAPRMPMMSPEMQKQIQEKMKQKKAVTK